MNKIMVDLETMGTSSNAAIVSIGAVEFDSSGLGREFYRAIDLESSIRMGGIVDASTVLWWMKQLNDARSSTFNTGLSYQLPVSLLELSGWMAQLGTKSDIEVWGNGAAFDNVILANAYKMCGLIQPWEFWGDRCYRTVKSLNPDIPFERIGTHHNALDDAKSQALHLVRILNHVN